MNNWEREGTAVLRHEGSLHVIVMEREEDHAGSTDGSSRGWSEEHCS